MRKAQLTDRERQITMLVALGKSNKNIGLELQIREPTVKCHLSRIFRKLGLKNRTELAIYGIRCAQELN